MLLIDGVQASGEAVTHSSVSARVNNIKVCLLAHEDPSNRCCQTDGLAKHPCFHVVADRHRHSKSECRRNVTAQPSCACALKSFERTLKPFLELCCQPACVDRAKNKADLDADSLCPVTVRCTVHAPATFRTGCDSWGSSPGVRAVANSLFFLSHSLDKLRGFPYKIPPPPTIHHTSALLFSSSFASITSASPIRTCAYVVAATPSRWRRQQTSTPTSMSTTTP